MPDDGIAGWLERRPWFVMLVVAVLSLAAYLRALGLPFIADDYLQITLARQFGPISGWAALASDGLYRCRATSLVLTYWTERLFGLDPIVYNTSSLILHIVNTWLVFALGCWRPIGWRISAVAACFFAFHQAHQEAVVWYSALPELLVFFFTLASFLCWVLWLQDAISRFWRYAASLALFVLALISKESAVVVVGLMLLSVALERTGWRRKIIWIIPFALLAAVYFLWTFATRAGHLHFHDGTFSLKGPVWIVLPRSAFRLLWFWGVVSLMALGWWRARHQLDLLRLAAAWIFITLLPYSFLTYMPHVPSRHTYFASVGLSLILAAGFLVFQQRFCARPAVIWIVAAVIVVHHCTYLWTRKHEQYVVRAAPTEALIEHARRSSGPLYVDCFPYDISLASMAVEIHLHDRPVPILQGRGTRDGLNLCRGFGGPVGTPQVR